MAGEQSGSPVTVSDLLVVSQPWNQKGKGGEVWFGHPGY